MVDATLELGETASGPDRAMPGKAITACGFESHLPHCPPRRAKDAAVPLGGHAGRGNRKRGRRSRYLGARRVAGHCERPLHREIRYEQIAQRPVRPGGRREQETHND